MSLINDALKRARQVQDPSPAPHIPGPPPGDTEPRASRSENPGLLFGLLALAVVVVLASGLVWALLRNGAQEPRTVKARSKDPAPAVTEKLSVPASSSVIAAATAAPLSPSQTPAAVLPTPPRSTSTPAPAPQTPVAQPAPTPPPLKLQAIVFNPRRPSAIVNGRTLFVGDRFQEMRVTSITASTATLVGGSQTNLLRLGE